MSADPDPSFAMQAALFGALTTSAAVAALIGNDALTNLPRIYDQPPDSPVFPYATIADAHVVDDWAEGIEGSQIYSDVHVWSRAVGHVEAKKICSAVRAAMCQLLVLVGHRVVVLEYVGTRHLTDPDGVTSHSIVTVRYSTEPTA